MDTLQLYSEMENAGVNFYTWELGDTPAATVEMDNRTAVFVDFDNINTEAQERVVISHEKGHIDTGATHPLASPYDLVEKHEYKAWKDAVLTLIPKQELDSAINNGCTELWMLADRFNVTETFMQMAVEYYNEGHLIISDDKNMLR